MGHAGSFMCPGSVGQKSLGCSSIYRKWLKLLLPSVSVPLQHHLPRSTRPALSLRWISYLQVVLRPGCDHHRFFPEQ
jgi:hypothetical protein